MGGKLTLARHHGTLSSSASANATLCTSSPSRRGLNAAVEVDASVPHVPSYAVTRLKQCCAWDRFFGHLNAVWVKQIVSAISKMEEVSRHERSSPFGRERIASLSHREAIKGSAMEL